MIPLIGLAESAISALAGKASGAAPAANPATASDQVAKIKKTSQQFEAIFVRQMLAAARKASPGDAMTDGQGVDSFREMQDAQFADIASQQGAFGIGKMIAHQLTHQAGLAASGSPAGGSGS